MKHECQQCGQAIPAEAPEALCPACLLEQGKSSSTTASSQTDPPATPEELKPLFPQLEILGFIGAGGMGGVYKARQQSLGRTVALKIVKVGDQPEWHERFLREGKALAQLNHPGIVQIHDSGVVNGLGYFIMEYVDGESLAAILRHEKVDPLEASDFVQQMCTALQYAHDQGVAHRDIKPANILINPDGKVKIADFGLAKLLRSENLGFQLTLSQEQVGTPYYMAPEQRNQGRAVDQRADIYAIGVVYYEMLTGHLPIGRVTPPSMHAVIDARLDELILSAMDTDPDRRPRSARGLGQTLAMIADSDPPREAEETNPEARAKSKRRAWLPWVIVPVAGVLGCVVMALAWPNDSPRFRSTAKVLILHMPGEEAAGLVDLDAMPAHYEAKMKEWADPIKIAESIDLPQAWQLTPSQTVRRLEKGMRYELQRGSKVAKLVFTDENDMTAQRITDEWTKHLAWSRDEEQFAVVRVKSDNQWNVFKPTPSSFDFENALFMEAVFERVLPFLELDPANHQQHGDLIAYLTDNVETKPVSKDTLKLRFKHADAKIAISITNALADALVHHINATRANGKSESLRKLEMEEGRQAGIMKEALAEMLALKAASKDPVAARQELFDSGLGKKHPRVIELDRLIEEIEPGAARPLDLVAYSAASGRYYQAEIEVKRLKDEIHREVRYPQLFNSSDPASVLERAGIRSRRSNEIKVIQEAQTAEPVPSSRPFYLVLGGVLGVLLGWAWLGLRR